MYKIYCKQRSGHYFADGAKFNSLNEVREQLISYHSIDCDENSLRNQSLADIANGNEWEIQDENNQPIDYEILKTIKWETSNGECPLSRM